ncbi:hypothetical protein MPER_06369, partial [Moniliophthora perniciosa FA553]
MLRAFSLGSITQVQRQRLPLQSSWRFRKYSVVGVSVGSIRDLPPHHCSQNGPVQEDPVREDADAGVQKQKQEEEAQVLDVQKLHQSHDDTEPDTGIDQDQHYVLTLPPFVAGKSWHQLPVRPLYGGKFRFGNKFLSSDPSTRKAILNRDKKEGLYYHLLHNIAKTQDHKKDYNEYRTLICHVPPSHPKKPKIPYAHLHRLLRLIAQHRPKTRSQFLHMLSVMSTIHSSGGKLKTWEWNALISHAGTGWRRARAEDWRMTLDTHDDMTSDSPPGASFSHDYATVPSPDPDPDENTQGPKPDLFTYNTLLSIATKTL